MRIVIVINKWWECEPAIAAMLSGNASPPPPWATPWPKPLNSPQYRPKVPFPAFVQPRAVFSYSNFAAELWCISDLLNDLDGAYQSSSSVKAERLRKIFVSSATPDLLVAVGTASSATELPNRNGGVAVGTAVFLHDAHPDGENQLMQTVSREGEVVAMNYRVELLDGPQGWSADTSI